MQRLDIENFGPIEQLSIDVKNFTLLVGPQASGKSTIAKTIFFFKSLNDDLMKFFFDALRSGDFSRPEGKYGRVIRQKFLDYFGSSLHLDSSFKMVFHYTDEVWIQLTLEPRNRYITPTLSREFIRVFKRLAKEANHFFDARPNTSTSILSSRELLRLETERREFLSYLETQCNHLFQANRDLVFIPAGRSLLATLADQLQQIDSQRLDYLMRSFVDKINLLRPLFGRPLEELVQEREILNQEPTNLALAQIAQNIIERILKGKYQYDRQGEKIYFREDKYIKLNFASSGQQESLWILLLLFLAVLEQQNLFVVIEEPEAHLFPEAQKEIAALIALAANLPSAQVVVTTHSPYILAAFNNLILAHRVGQRYPEAVRPRIEEAIWLNIENTQAYFVEQGQMHSIIDPELQLIQQETIDTISQTINAEFDFLFDLDLS